MIDERRERIWTAGFVLLYVATFSPLLLIEGVFWDDWTLLGHMREDLVSTFSQLGMRQVGALHYQLVSTPEPVLLYRTLIGAAYLGTALLLNGILRTRSEVTSGLRYALVGVFTFFPINSARVTLICLPYALCLLACYAGFWCVARATRSERPWPLLFASIPCFWAAALTGSIRMFMAAVFVVLAVDAVESWRGIRAAVLRYRPYIVVALLPPVLHVYYLRVHAPNGNFVGYNAVDPAMLAESYKLVEPTFVRSFLWPLLGSLESAVAVHDFVTMAGVCVVGAVLFLWRRLGCRSAGTMILSGALAWLLGSIPYNALGRMPAQDDWWSRDQLLLGLGAALLIVGTGYAATLARHTPRWLSGSAAVALIAYLAVSTHVALMRYQADWFKQESLGLAFEALPAVRDNTVFLITDETRALNVNQRYYRFYEYTGLLKRSFGDETRYAADYTAAEEQQIRSGTLFTPRHNHSYNLGGFRPTKDVVRLRIRYGSHGPELRDGGYWATAALLFDRFYRPTLYQAAIRNVVAVDVMDDGA